MYVSPIKLCNQKQASYQINNNLVLQLTIKNIHKMIDLYLVITPLFSVLTIFSLIALKITLRSEGKHIDPLLFQQSIVNKQKRNQVNEDKQQATPFASTFCFMIKNCTLAEICVTRKAKNKIPMLMALSIIASLCFFIPSIYMFVLVGTLVNVTFLIVRLCRFNNTTQQQQKSPNVIINENIQNLQRNVKVKGVTENQKSFECAFYTFSSIITIGLMTFLSVWFFKDYRNQILQQFLINFTVNCSIDFLSIQPIVYLILSFPLSRLQRMQHFVKKQQEISYFESLSIKQVKKLQRKQIGLHTTVGFSPKKKRLSPSKVPKVFDMNMFDKDKVTTVRKSKLQSLFTEDQSKIKKDNQDLLTAIQMSKRIKKQRKQLMPLMTPNNRNQRTEETQEALNNTNQQLKVGTPIAHMRNNEADELNQSCNGSNYRRKSFNFANNKTLEPDRQRPTNDRPFYIKKVKTQNDEQRKITIKSPNLRSPIKSPYEAQFQQYQRERLEGTISKKDILNKSKTDSVDLKLTKSSKIQQKQQFQHQIEASTEIVKMNLKKKIQDMQTTNQQRINRFNLQSNNNISIKCDKQDKKSQKSNSFISKQHGQKSIGYTIQSNLDNSMNRKPKFAHNNFNNDQNQDLELDETPNKLFRKKTISDISDAEGEIFTDNQINLIGRNISIINHRGFDDDQLNYDSEQQGIQERMPGSEYMKKRNSNGFNESFEVQRDKNGFKNTLLQIKEQTPNQIEQLDVNSPERRRRKKFEGSTPNREGYIKQGYNSSKRPPKRKYSSGKRRVIKFSNGQPYLQYLPNMLSKELQKNQNQKKSQMQLKVKQQSQNDKKRKSVRRLKNTKDPIVPINDQNDCPQFRVEDL